MLKNYAFLIAAAATGILANAQLGPDVTSWIRHNGEFGSYYNVGNFTPIPTTDTANVKAVYYSATNVYLRCSGVPEYPTGPFQDGNPSQTDDGNYLFRIIRSPQPNTGTATATGLGQIGVFINGVPMYNYADAMSYNNQNIWHRNAVVAENAGFDCAKGHPAMSHYHHHQNPVIYTNSFNPLSAVCTDYPSSGLYTLDSTVHSPLLGYAFDGYPVYGPYGYANADGSGGLRRITSSYRMRNITTRTTLPDGTVLNASQYGPNVSTTYPLGLYKEDFEFVSGLGDLDEHNGRFCVTPEYPAGTYCYYATVDEDWNAAYPYLIGPAYYGVVATDNFPSGGPGNFGTSVVISEPVTQYTGSGNVGLNGETDLSSLVQVYPNPVWEQFHVQIPAAFAGYSIAIFSSTGQEIYRHSQEMQSGVNSLQITGVPAGVYYLVLFRGEEKLVKKLIKL